MICLLILIALNFSFLDLSQARHHNNLPSTAAVVGTVFCDTCFQDTFSKSSHFISGATVAVECGDGGSNPSFRDEVKTDKTGEFKIQLPVSVRKIEECYVRLIRSSEPYCAVAARAKSSSLKLKSRKQGTHVFSAGFFTFKPLKHPKLCSHNSHSSEFDDTKQVVDFPGLPAPIQNPTVPNVPRIYDNLPPLTLLPGLPPLPQLPPLPPLPPLPVFPLFPPKKDDENVQTPKISQNPDMFHPQTLLPIPSLKPLRPHFVMPPHKLRHHPLTHGPFSPSFSTPTPPSAAADELAPSPPLPFSLPPIPRMPEISSPPKETSP
ncbi:amyloid beta A4 precursor protein-binding family B member 1-interacting protein-like [Cucurbita moschata]|uniref:Amyloid beta A4 precursor protein-binding family B member 1-interacting protein-like n=1 Tax=Cucurbita moschata TaxID=3662 RepID=A0A6J1HD47_CUCMO|nr:amyloid beta A4 precursor protein-binding family B member 1-interacting protein-like [Cucurbita moschata]